MAVFVEFRVVSDAEIRAVLVEDPPSRGGTPLWEEHDQLRRQADAIAVKLLGEDVQVKDHHPNAPRIYRSTRPLGEWKQVQNTQR